MYFQVNPLITKPTMIITNVSTVLKSQAQRVQVPQRVQTPVQLHYPYPQKISSRNKMWCRAMQVYAAYSSSQLKCFVSIKSNDWNHFMLNSTDISIALLSIKVFLETLNTKKDYKGFNFNS